MKDVSLQFYEAMHKRNRNFKLKLDFGEFIIEKGENFKIQTMSSPTNGLTFGTTAIGNGSFELSKNPYDVMGKTFRAYIGMNFGGDFEWLKLGKYEVYDTKQTGTKTEILFQDDIAKLDIAFDRQIGYPISALDLLEEIETICGVVFDNSEIPLTLQIEKNVSNYSCRKIVEFIAQLVGCFVVIDSENENISFKWYENNNYIINKDNYLYMIKEPTGGESFMLGAISCDNGEEDVLIAAEENATGVITLSNPLMTQSILNNIFDLRKGFTYQMAEVPFMLGNPLFDVWDIINVEYQSKSLIIPCMSIENKFDGGFSTTIKSFVRNKDTAFEGTITKEFNNIKTQITILDGKVESKVEETTFEGAIDSTIQYADDAAKNAEENANKNTENQLKNYPTTTQMQSDIQQSAEQISLSVSRNYTTKDETNALSTIVANNSTRISQTANEVATEVVHKNKVVASINASTEGVQIAASKINITGAVTFNALDSGVKSVINNTANTVNNWSSKDDNTYIDGGKLYTNSVKSTQIDTQSLFAETIKVSGKFEATANVFIRPGQSELTKIREHVFGYVLIPSNEIPLYDFNADGAVTETDLIQAISLMNGESSIDDYPEYKSRLLSLGINPISTVGVVIEPSNTDNVLHVMATNIWGRNVDTIIGASEFRTDNLNANDIVVNYSDGTSTNIAPYVKGLHANIQAQLDAISYGETTKLNNYFTTRPTTANIHTDGSGGVITFKATSSMTGGKPVGDGHIIHLFWDNMGGYDTQLFLPNAADTPQWRIMAGGNWSAWCNFLTDLNYSDYPTKTPQELFVKTNSGNVLSFNGSKAKTINFLAGDGVSISSTVDGNITISAKGGTSTGEVGRTVYEATQQYGLYCDGNINPTSINSVEIEDLNPNGYYKRFRIYVRTPYGLACTDMPVDRPQTAVNATFGNYQGGIILPTGDNVAGATQNYIAKISWRLIFEASSRWIFQVTDSGWVNLGTGYVAESDYQNGNTAGITNAPPTWNQRHNSDYSVYKILGYTI